MDFAISITTYRHVVKNCASTSVLGKTWCGRSVRPTDCDCTDTSHQFLRPHHTTITTNHHTKKKSRRGTRPQPSRSNACQKRHVHVFQQGRRDWSQEGQREVQELDIRMCCNHIKSEPRSQTFTFHSRPSPLCVWEYVKLTPHWQLDESCAFSKMVSRMTRRRFHVQEDIWTSVRTHETQPNNPTKTSFVVSSHDQRF